MPIGWAITVVVLCVAVIVLAVIVLGLLRQVTPVLERVAAGTGTLGSHAHNGPAVGSPLPHFAVPGPDGEFTAEQLRGQATVLLFLTVGCGPCQELAEEMSRTQLGHLAGQVVVITSPDGPQELGIPAGVRILTEREKEVSGPLSVVGTPFAVAMDEEGIVRFAVVLNTVDQLEVLVGDLANQASAFPAAHLPADLRYLKLSSGDIAIRADKMDPVTVLALVSGEQVA
jgi:hypothetical protein